MSVFLNSSLCYSLCSLGSLSQPLNCYSPLRVFLCTKERLICRYRSSCNNKKLYEGYRHTTSFLKYEGLPYDGHEYKIKFQAQWRVF